MPHYCLVLSVLSVSPSRCVLKTNEWSTSVLARLSGLPLSDGVPNQEPADVLLPGTPDGPVRLQQPNDRPCHRRTNELPAHQHGHRFSLFSTPPPFLLAELNSSPFLRLPSNDSELQGASRGDLRWPHRVQPNHCLPLLVGLSPPSLHSSLSLSLPPHLLLPAFLKKGVTPSSTRHWASPSFSGPLALTGSTSDTLA